MNDNKKPVSEKGVKKESFKFEDQTYEDFHDNQLHVPKAIKDECSAKGLDIRWINLNEYVRRGYIHKHHWQAYKPDTKTGDLKYGTDVNGFIRRGDAVLAVRRKEVSTQYKAHVEQRQKMYNNYEKAAAEGLRQQLRQAGINTKVSEGYEGNN